MCEGPVQVKELDYSRGEIVHCTWSQRLASYPGLFTSWSFRLLFCKIGARTSKVLEELNERIYVEVHYLVY